MPPPPLTSPPCPSRWRQQASSMANWTHALLIDAMWRASLRFSAGRSPGVITSRRIVHARAPRPMGALDLLIAAPRMSNGWRSSASSCPRIVLHAVARRPESSFRHRGGGGGGGRSPREDRDPRTIGPDALLCAQGAPQGCTGGLLVTARWSVARLASDRAYSNSSPSGRGSTGDLDQG